jgi:dTDP-4-amino-4,6-dideoxygalactose transaminase
MPSSIVPMSDLRGEYAEVRGPVDEAVSRVLESGHYVLGEEVEAFEDAFARMCGARHAVGVGSGTAALQLALAACGFDAGDEILTVPNTDSPTASAVTGAGGSVGFVDVDPRTFCMDAARLAERISPRTAAVIPVHLFGHPADMEAILAVARRHGLLVVEDAALAVGARYAGRHVGTFGEIGCFSLAPSKILGGYGDGGIVVTDDAEIARRIRVLRNYGHAPEMVFDERDLRGFDRWRVVAEGANQRLDALQAAVLAAKLPTLEDRIARRRAAASRYDALLADTPVATPHEAPGARHVYFAYTILLDDRERARDALAAEGIASRLYYNPPLHLQPAYERLGLGPGAYPVAEATAERMLALPVFPQITDAQIERVAAAVAGFAAERSGGPTRP